MNSILALDFSPSGYYLASGSEDHTVRVWDLRKKRSLYTIPAHKSLVSQVRARPLMGGADEKGPGNCLLRSNAVQ